MDVQASVRLLPKIEGPITVSETSYPFNAMRFSRSGLDVAGYGFVEEEYFLSATANVYTKSPDGQLQVEHAALPYKNRILVRRPADKAKYTGRVYMDILNASNGYDIEDLWNRSWRWILESGHAYVGVTSKPCCVQSLKFFDPQRYRTLNWSAAQSADTAPATPYGFGSLEGTEEGLAWDILSQAANLLRNGGMNNALGGYPVDYLCLTGQSQSGGYINTYVDNFHPYLKDAGGKKLFDGYLNIAGVPMERSLEQEPYRDDYVRLRMLRKPDRPVDTPFIFITSEGDTHLFSINASTLPANSDTPEHKVRYYEIPASPHTDLACPVLPCDEALYKVRSRPTDLSDELMSYLNDMPLAYYVNALLEKLYTWWRDGVAPETVSRFERDAAGALVRDEHGNTRGGLRHTFVEVPAASYCGWLAGAPYGEMSGEKVPFSKAKLEALYGSLEGYVTAFSVHVRQQIAVGWLTDTDGAEAIAWAKKTAQAAK